MPVWNFFSQAKKLFEQNFIIIASTMQKPDFSYTKLSLRGIDRRLLVRAGNSADGAPSLPGVDPPGPGVDGNDCLVLHGHRVALLDLLRYQFCELLLELGDLLVGRPAHVPLYRRPEKSTPSAQDAACRLPDPQGEKKIP